MLAAIIGDSFVKDYQGTYLENIVTDCDLELISHAGFPGHSQYKIWENFHQILARKPQVVIMVHTEYSRLYHPTIPINPNIEHFTFDQSVRPEIISAAQMYYEHLYDANYSFNVYQLLIQDIQNKCQQLGIKLINIPAFDSANINKFYGLWLVSEIGLSGCSKADWPDWHSNMLDTRVNHFTPAGHQILANNAIPHIKNYLKNNTDLEIHMIHPQYFG
jgi:hypothetical protein